MSDTKNRPSPSRCHAFEVCCAFAALLILADAAVEERPHVVFSREAYDSERQEWRLAGQVRFERTRYLGLPGREWHSVVGAGQFDFLLPDPDGSMVRREVHRDKAIVEARKNTRSWSVSVPALVITWAVYALSCWTLWLLVRPAGRRHRAELALPFLMPFLFAAVHGPLDEKYIVEWLGCGCFPGYNANSFAAILFFTVWLVCSLFAVSRSHDMRSPVRVAYVICASVFALLATRLLDGAVRWM